LKLNFALASANDAQFRTKYATKRCTKIARKFFILYANLCYKFVMLIIAILHEIVICQSFLFQIFPEFFFFYSQKCGTWVRMYKLVAKGQILRTTIFLFSQNLGFGF